MNTQVLNEIKKIKKMMLIEASEANIKNILAKFKKEDPNINDAEAIELIKAFERIKQALSVDKKDITRYTFSALKNLVASQEKSMSQKKSLKNAITHFRKMGSKAQNEMLIRGIRNFFEIEDMLPKSEQNIFDYDDFSTLEYNLYRRSNYNYNELIKKKLIDNFKKEGITETQILYYVNKYINENSQYDINTPRVDTMSFADFEALVDANSKEEIQQIDAFQDINKNIVYNDKNITIYLADEKPVAIALGFGRSWCTSRKGGGNLFYNYRFDKNLTIYHVVNHTLDYNDINYTLVVLVDPQGNMRLADKTNSGDNAGITVVAWDTITRKCKFLEDLKYIFKPIPLTKSEQALYAEMKKIEVGNNPTAFFNNDDVKVALWLELTSEKISDEQYKNLSSEMQKKYVALGYSLNYSKLENTKQDTLEYIITKSIGRISQLKLSELSHDDIVLLNSNTGRMNKIKKERKSDFEAEINMPQAADSRRMLDIQYPETTDSKYAALYGLDDLFNKVNEPEKYSTINISTKNSGIDDVTLNIEIPRSIGKFVNINTLSLSGGVIKIPEEICKLENLTGLFIRDNKRLTTIPSCIFRLPRLVSINLSMNPSLSLPNEIFERYDEVNHSKFFNRKKSK